MPVHPVERKLAAIFAADIAGYSRLMARDEVGTLARLKACRAIIDELIASHRGRIFNTAGDSVVADFASAVDAVQCAVAVQAAITTESAKQPAEDAMQFRIGVHVGDVMVDGENLLGDGVNIAARLESLAEPGAIYVSAVVRDQVGNKLPLDFGDLGDQQVKNIAQAIRVYRVQATAPTTPPLAALPLPEKPSIAVLPFQNMSGDPEQEYFADGMVEEIITALSRIRWLFVIARNSSFTYKGQAVDVKQVGRELGVRYVLEGSVRKGGNRVRITAQLIDAATGVHLWADRFDGSLDDVFELQDDVAAAVAGVIEPALQAAEVERARRKQPESLDAYDLYLRALPELYRSNTVEGTGRALALLRRAIAIDPGYAAALAQAGLCFTWRRIYGWMEDEASETAEGITLGRAAILAARDDATALAWGGMAVWNQDGDAEAAIRTLDRAVGINPNLAAAWGCSGLVHAYAGDSAVAIECCARAMRLSPVDPLKWVFFLGTGIAYFGERRLEVALVWLQRAREEAPTFPVILAFLASTLVHLGRLDEARAMTEHLDATGRRYTATAPWDKFFKNPTVWEFFRDGLRRAGLPVT